MNFILSITATIFYALQAVLMAGIAREYDSLFAQTLRGVSFGITMLPLLIFSFFISNQDSIQIVLFDNFYLLMLAIGFAGIGNWCIASANTFLPVAYGSAFGTTLLTVFLSLIGYFYFGDNISVAQIILIIILIICVYCFVYLRNYPAINYSYKPFYGYMCAFGFALFMSLAFTFVAELSRLAHPFSVAFFWEFGIGVFLSILFLIRKIFFKGKIYNINKALIVKVTLYASPTIVGTACYASALKIGPISLVGAVHTSLIFFIAIFSSFRFKEHLGMKHWVLVFIMFILLVLIKLN